MPTSVDLSRILFFDFIYRQQVDVTGIVTDIGGHNVDLFNSLREIYELYNVHRKVIGIGGEDELATYLENRPETVISLAYFDLNEYQPTRVCLEKILPHLTRGSVVGFERMGVYETQSLAEVFGLANVALHRYPYAPDGNYFVF